MGHAQAAEGQGQSWALQTCRRATQRTGPGDQDARRSPTPSRPRRKLGPHTGRWEQTQGHSSHRSGPSSASVQATQVRPQLTICPGPTGQDAQHWPSRPHTSGSSSASVQAPQVRIHNTGRPGPTGRGPAQHPSRPHKSGPRSPSVQAPPVRIHNTAVQAPQVRTHYTACLSPTPPKDCTKPRVWPHEVRGPVLPTSQDRTQHPSSSPA